MQRRRSNRLVNSQPTEQQEGYSNVQEDPPSSPGTSNDTTHHIRFDTGSSGSQGSPLVLPKKRARPGRPLLCELDPSSNDISDDLKKLLQRRKNNREYARRMNLRRRNAINDLREEVAQLLREISQSEGTIDEENLAIHNLQSQLAEAEATMSAVSLESDNLKEQLAQLEASHYLLSSVATSSTSEGGAELHGGQGDPTDEYLCEEDSDPVELFTSIKGIEDSDPVELFTSIEGIETKLENELGLEMSW